jgi:hypothetical protein
VANTEARNDLRFSGPGTFAGFSLRGHLHEARITVLDGAAVRPRHLNKHIDYDVVPSPAGVAEPSLAQPLGMAVSGDGRTLYVAAFGSGAVGVFDTAALEADTFAPDAAAHIPLAGGGPTGVVLDEARGRLYVATRFDNAVTAVRTDDRTEVARVGLHDPEPVAFRAGRPLFMDARLTSSNGEASCASCHVFGDVDGLAWDLGNPDARVVADPNPTRERPDDIGFHPMKGPMVTQTLRGISTHGPMHWRGDRSGALDPGGDPFDERAALRQFNEAYENLLGRAAPLDAAALEAMVDFGLGITPPPNPIRALDGSLTPVEADGRTGFLGPNECSTCHRLDPAQGFFGTDGFLAFSKASISQFVKIPPLDVLYQKVGMFERRPPINNGDTTPVGPQVRGFGFFHSGEQGLPGDAENVLLFLFAFDGRLAPVVGQQVTLFPGATAAAAERADLLVARAAAGECDLVVHGVADGGPRGWLFTGGGFRPDRTRDPVTAEAALRAEAAAEARTYTCVPPGAGSRLALDRDADGVLDGDERDTGSDPADPASRPLACDARGALKGVRVKVRRNAAPAGDEAIELRAFLRAPADADPSGTGLGLTVTSSQGLVLARVLPGGAPHWKRRKRRWTYVATDRDAPGVRDVVVQRRRGGLSIRVTGDGARFQLPPPEFPLELSVGLDGGRCGTVALEMPGTRRDGCRLRPKSDTLVCRRR